MASNNGYRWNQSTYDYVKLYIGYFSNRIPVWEGTFTLSADTIITLYHWKLFKDLRVDLYSSVIHHWNRQLNPYSFPLRKNRVN